jgi:hypothetical protein
VGAEKKDGDMQIKQGVATTTIKHPTGVEETKEEPVGEPQGFVGPTCNVGMKVGHTRNLGNYESLRVDITLNMPCYQDEIDLIVEFERKWLFEKMDETSNYIDQELASE